MTPLTFDQLNMLALRVTNLLNLLMPVDKNMPESINGWDTLPISVGHVVSANTPNIGIVVLLQPFIVLWQDGTLTQLQQMPVTVSRLGYEELNGIRTSCILEKITPELISNVLEMVQEDDFSRKVPAIKYFREVMDCTLLDAKLAVDAIMRGDYPHDEVPTVTVTVPEGIAVNVIQS